MKFLLLVAFFFPLVAFCIAGVGELRSTTNAVAKLRGLVPVILGIAVFGISLAPQFVFEVTPSSSITLSRAMTMISAIIACSGAFIVYSRRSSSVWVACGGLVLAFSWMFNRVLA
jgi:hypothetical protein